MFCHVNVVCMYLPASSGSVESLNDCYALVIRNMSTNSKLSSWGRGMWGGRTISRHNKTLLTYVPHHHCTNTRTGFFFLEVISCLRISSHPFFLLPHLIGFPFASKHSDFGTLTPSNSFASGSPFQSFLMWYICVDYSIICPL